MDGYNFGTCSHGSTSYSSFDQVFRSTYDKLLAIANKPIMLAEVGCEECGGSKSAWYTDMLTTQLPTNYPAIGAFVYWNSNNDTSDMIISSSSSALSAFAKGIASPEYLSNAYSGLNSSPIPAP
jgi:beta-mannanase